MQSQSNAGLLWQILRKSMSPQKLSSIGEMLRVGTLLMPAGGGGEIASEGIQTLVAVLSLYSDSVLSGSAFGRFQVIKSGGNSAVRCFSGVFLEAIRRIELLAEMISERIWGGKGALKMLLFFELIKAICKIYLCYRGKDVDQKGSKTSMARAPGFLVCRDFMGLKASDSFSDLRWWLAGSVIHSVRPVIYLLAMIAVGTHNKAVHSRTRWTPWLLSLFLDLVAHFVASKASAARDAAKPRGPFGADDSGQQGTGRPHQQPPAVNDQASGVGDIFRVALFQEEECCDTSDVSEHNALERAELSRRKGLLLLYLLRPPAMDALLKPMVALLRRIVGRIPLVGSVANLLLDLLVSLEHYYSYSSGS